MATEQRFARISDALIAQGFIAVTKAIGPGAGLEPSLPRLLRAGLHGLSKLPPEQVREAWEASEVRAGWPARTVPGEVITDDGS